MMIYSQKIYLWLHVLSPKPLWNTNFFVHMYKMKNENPQSTYARQQHTWQDSIYVIYFTWIIYTYNLHITALKTFFSYRNTYIINFRLCRLHRIFFFFYQNLNFQEKERENFVCECVTSCVIYAFRFFSLFKKEKKNPTEYHHHHHL